MRTLTSGIGLAAVLAWCVAAQAQTPVVYNTYKDRAELPDAIEFDNVDGRDVVRMTSYGELPEAGQSLYYNLSASEAIYFPVEDITLGDITALNVEYMSEAGLVAGGGWRMFIGLDLNGNGVYDVSYDPVNNWQQEDGHLFAHLTQPWNSQPGSGWQVGAAIIDVSSTVKQYETGQVGGNTTGHTYAEVLNLINPYDGTTPIADLQVLAIGFANDSSWAQDADNIVEPTDYQSMLVGDVLFEATDILGAPVSHTVSFGAGVVPEPTTMVLLGLGSLALLRRRR